MHTRTTTAAAVILAAGLTLTACSSSSHPDKPADATTQPVASTAAPNTAPIPDSALAKGARTAACWRAIRDQYEPGTANLTGAPTEPPACQGLSTDEVSDIAEDVLEHQSDG